MIEAVIAFAIGMFGTYTMLDIAHARIQKKRKELITLLNLNVK